MAQQSYRVFYPIRYQGTLYGPRDGFDADDADPEIIAFAEYGEIALVGPAPEPLALRFFARATNACDCSGVSTASGCPVRLTGMVDGISQPPLSNLPQPIAW